MNAYAMPQCPQRVMYVHCFLQVRVRAQEGVRNACRDWHDRRQCLPIWKLEVASLSYQMIKTPTWLRLELEGAEMLLVFLTSPELLLASYNEDRDRHHANSNFRYLSF
jgi:hypothetical protein